MENSKQPSSASESAPPSCPPKNKYVLRRERKKAQPGAAAQTVTGGIQISKSKQSSSASELAPPSCPPKNKDAIKRGRKKAQPGAAAQTVTGGIQISKPKQPSSASGSAPPSCIPKIKDAKTRGQKKAQPGASAQAVTGGIQIVNQTNSMDFPKRRPLNISITEGEPSENTGYSNSGQRPSNSMGESEGSRSNGLPDAKQHSAGPESFPKGLQSSSSRIADSAASTSAGLLLGGQPSCSYTTEVQELSSSDFRLSDQPSHTTISKSRIVSGLPESVGFQKSDQASRNYFAGPEVPSNTGLPNHDQLSRSSIADSEPSGNTGVLKDSQSFNGTTELGSLGVLKRCQSLSNGIVEPETSISFSIPKDRQLSNNGMIEPELLTNNGIVEPETSRSTGISKDRQSSTNSITDPGSVEIIGGQSSHVSIAESQASESAETWNFIRELPLEDLNEFVSNFEQGYRLKSKNTPAKGHMQYYNCSRIKVRAKPQCRRQLLAFIPNSSGAVYISARGRHSCHEAPPQNVARSKITTADQQLLDTLVASGIPSKHVKVQLRANNTHLTKGSVNYAVKACQKKLFGTGNMSLGELEAWIACNSAIPDDPKTAFVIGKDIDHDNGKFRLVISSKRLLTLLTRFSTIAADCTFKTTMQGYPLLVVCVIDAMRRAHPVAFACLTNQEQLDYRFVFETLLAAALAQGGLVRITCFLSDGELGLKNAARLVFGQSVILLNCYFHVKQNLEKHFKKSHEVPAEVQEQIKKEFCLLQIAPTKQHFNAALELFVDKYKMYPEFSSFFEKYARNDKFSLWYEAAMPGIPATNNAIEAINKSIKYNYLKRHKEPFSTFKVQMMNIITAYSDPERAVADERSISITDERKAFDYIQSSKKIRTVNNNDQGKTFVYVPGAGRREVSAFDIERFENPEFVNLEEYTEDLGQMHRVEIKGGNLKLWNCTCAHFFKTNGCAHILVVAVKRMCYTLRAEADTALMSSKKTGGRPKFITKALCKD